MQYDESLSTFIEETYGSTSYKRRFVRNPSGNILVFKSEKKFQSLSHFFRVKLLYNMIVLTGYQGKNSNSYRRAKIFQPVPAGVRSRVTGSTLYRQTLRPPCKSGLLLQSNRTADAANYRPVSLTCICCKTLEHILVSNSNKHLALDSIVLGPILFLIFYKRPAG